MDYTEQKIYKPRFYRNSAIFGKIDNAMWNIVDYYQGDPLPLITETDIGISDANDMIEEELRGD